MSSGVNPQLLMTLIQNFFVRNNPVAAMAQQLPEALEYWSNYDSHKKLRRYETLLNIQQMENLQRNMSAGAKVPMGSKLNKIY